ncbi:Hypothetical predicted protein [Pelobates cultripes]|uniref:Uncharacterized protein n=1 Tax=Pelobates cultripes TaxID=61616 RepID=A0AAD1T4V4_PELCU|nr:Hypothetical predicted protein [Pelobates cultripes]CAH2318856.1 Hypothetical predicted protein [Pelobates cultripes]
MNQCTSHLPCLNLQGPTSSSAGSEPKHIPFRGHQRTIEGEKKTIPKVKRRKTKKELDAKFHKSEMETFRSKGSRRLLKKQDLSRNPFCSRVVQSSVQKCACNSNPVIITQNRLSHHQGMFNREVKSVDIGRLLTKEPENKDNAELDLQKHRSKSEGNIGQDCSSCSTALPPRTESQQNDSIISLKSRGPKTPIQPIESVTDIVQNEEKTPLSGQEGNVHRPTSWSSSETELPEVETEAAPVFEVAEEIFKMLDTQVLFPGRNLVNEIQKAIMENMRQNHEKDTNRPAVPAQSELDYGFKGKPFA